MLDDGGFGSKAPKRPWTPVRLMEVDWNLQVRAQERGGRVEQRIVRAYAVPR